MGYVVTVEPEKLRTTASKILQYITAHQNKMNSINREIVALRNVEIGTEFDAFQTKWSAVYGPTSTSAKMIACMKSYADYLKSCASYYEIVESNARIRASQIY